MDLKQFFDSSPVFYPGSGLDEGLGFPGEAKRSDGLPIIQARARVKDWARVKELFQVHWLAPGG